jgi:putative (di)nucleoside polyphosphate hydrolase
MIDADGYRANVGIVLINDLNQVLLAKRIGEDAWQLPQGGIAKNENDIDALYRELAEEVGLSKSDVEIIAKTPKWLRYDLPEDKRSRFSNCIGQKQVWFLLKLKSADDKIKLDAYNEVEFDDWNWVNYWQPIEEVVDFKKSVYEDMLKALAPVAFANEHQIPPHLTRPLSCTAISF